MSTHERPYRGNTNEWLTPPKVLRALGEFDLDPCSPSTRPWATAANHFTKNDDGLSKAWRGRVWLNPPYGPDTGKWLKKLADHGNGIALIFARIETAMFFDYVWDRASAILFLRGRLHFHKPDGARAIGKATAPSCLVAYGQENVAAIRDSRIEGRLVVLIAKKEKKESFAEAAS